MRFSFVLWLVLFSSLSWSALASLSAPHNAYAHKEGNWVQALAVSCEVRFSYMEWNAWGEDTCIAPKGHE